MSSSSPTPLMALCLATAERLAGQPRDGLQRAHWYRQMYRASGGNHVFPLIAAHGSVWGAAHLATLEAAAHRLARLWPASSAYRAQRLAQVLAFADALRAVNRSVFVAHAAAWLAVQQLGSTAPMPEGVDAQAWHALCHCQSYTERGERMPTAQLRATFFAFFRWEQRTLVTHAVDAAMRAFDWRWMRALMLRPAVRFSYFPRGTALRFRNLGSEAERTAQALVAFDMAARHGFDRVADAVPEPAAHAAAGTPRRPIGLRAHAPVPQLG